MNLRSLISFADFRHLDQRRKLPEELKIALKVWAACAAALVLFWLLFALAAQAMSDAANNAAVDSALSAIFGTKSANTSQGADDDDD